MNPRIISADDHIDLQWLPKGLWQKRAPPAWRDRAPKVVETPEGPYWVCGNDRWDPWGGRKGAAGAQGGRRTALEKGGVLEPGVLRPTTTELRLTDMDRDGIDATVMYGPIVPLLIRDPDLRGRARASSGIEDRARRNRDRLAALHARADGRHLPEVPRRRGVLAEARRASADDGAERLFPTAGVGDLPDGSPRAAGRGPPGGRPGDVGVRLPPRRQHVARVAAGDRGQLQRRRAPGAPPHPVRQRAGVVRALTPGEVQVCSEAPVDAQEHWVESRVEVSVDGESHVSA